MVTNIALIRGGVVENVIRADLAFAQKLGYDAAVSLSDKLTCSAGDLWDGKLFTPGPVDVAAESQRTIESQAEQSLDHLRAYISLAAPTAAQRLAFERLVARTLIGLVRLQLKKLDGAG